MTICPLEKSPAVPLELAGLSIACGLQIGNALTAMTEMLRAFGIGSPLMTRLALVKCGMANVEADTMWELEIPAANEMIAWERSL